jgi:hypothetical protein
MQVENLGLYLLYACVYVHTYMLQVLSLLFCLDKWPSSLFIVDASLLLKNLIACYIQ